MLRHDIIYDVIWHMLRAYNRPGTASWGDSWFNSRWVRRYTCMHRLMHWCSVLREPTSFKFNWLGCYNLSVCAPCPSADAPIHSENGPGVPCLTLGVPSPQDRHAFWLVPVCTIYWVVKFTSLEAHYQKGKIFMPHRCGIHHNYWCPWVGASWNDTNGPT